ncbi:hypothetical protein WDW37_07325 [Bdellovibrionota bacterium FG-1]
MEEQKGSNGSCREDGQPKQFVRIGMSKDGKWYFVDTITRTFIHINYLAAIRKNKDAALAQEAATSVGKAKRARKENDRAS